MGVGSGSGAVRVGGTLVLAVLVMAATVAGLVAIRGARPVLVTTVVPAGYAGWVVVAWSCPGGSPLRDHFVGGRRYELAASTEGAVCLADAVPSTGYHMNYRHAALAGSLDASPFYRVDPVDVFPGTSRSPTLDPRLGASGSARYDIAWVDVRERPGGGGDAFGPGDRHLGDQCDLARYLSRAFGEPPADVPCGVIPARPAAGLSGRDAGPSRPEQSPDATAG